MSRNPVQYIDTMANDYLIAKWKLWYVSLDVNHDGKISMEDAEESRSKFSDLHHLNETQKATVEANFTQWWNEFVFRGKTGEIELDEFVATLNKDFTADKAKFIAHMTKCFNIFFAVIDTNHDKDISLDEFLIAFKAYGHENVAKDETFFASYKPINGVVTLSKIVESWIDFVTGEDDTKSGDIVKKAFEGGA